MKLLVSFNLLVLLLMSSNFIILEILIIDYVEFNMFMK